MPPDGSDMLSVGNKAMGQEDDCRAERGFQHSLKVMELIFRQLLLVGNLCTSTFESDWNVRHS